MRHPMYVNFIGKFWVIRRNHRDNNRRHNGSSMAGKIVASYSGITLKPRVLRPAKPRNEYYHGEQKDKCLPFCFVFYAFFVAILLPLPPQRTQRTHR